MSGARPARLTDLARGDLASLRAFLSGQGTRGTSFAAQLDAIPHLDATVDSSGRLRMNADAGHGFDFAPVLNTAPNAAGTLGGARCGARCGGVAPR